MAPPLVGTRGFPGHYTVLGHQPASDVAVTKSKMTKRDVEQGLRDMKLALLAKEAKALEERERLAGQGNESRGVPPSTLPVSKTGAIGDVQAMAGGQGHGQGGSEKSSGKSKKSKGSNKGPKKGPKRIRGQDGDNDDEDFDDDDWDEDDYDSEGNYIAGDRDDEDEGDGEKPEGVHGREDDGGDHTDPPAAVAAAPSPEPWAVRRKRELAEAKAKERELQPNAKGNRKDSVLSSLGKTWGISEVRIG